MNIVRIDKDNMLNGEGIRAVVWTCGCSHHCFNCQNPETWNPAFGHEFSAQDKKYLFELLEKDYISGVTFSGGDPLYITNASDVLDLCTEIKQKFPTKNIWVYTGYTLEELIKKYSLKYLKSHIDVLVDGEYKEELKDFYYHWAGSTNQRVIRLKEVADE